MTSSTALDLANDPEEFQSIEERVSPPTPAQPGRGRAAGSLPVSTLAAIPTLWTLQRQPLRLMRDLYDRPAGVHVATLLGRKYLIVTDPDTIRYVLVENAGNWRKNYGAFMRAVGRSSLVTHGEEWRGVRRVNQRAFRADRLTRVVAENRPIIDAFVAGLEEKARTGTPIDVCSTFGGLMISLTSGGMFARRSRRSDRAIFADVDCFLPVMDRCALSVTALGRWAARSAVAGVRVRRLALAPTAAGVARRRRRPAGRRHAARHAGGGVRPRRQ